MSGRFTDLEMEIEGDDFTYSLTFTDSDDNALDITNWTVWLTLKDHPSDADSDAKFQKKVTSHTDPSNGKTEITVESSDMEDREGVYYYDMQYKDDSGNVVTFLWGKINIRKGITDATG